MNHNKHRSDSKINLRKTSKYRFYYSGVVKAKVESLESKDRKSILNWFDEEQGVLLEVAEEYLRYAIKNSTGDLCIEPGCGSGILSLALVKKYEKIVRQKIKTIYAIDVNNRALKYVRANSKCNGVQDLYKLIEGRYVASSAPKKKAALILHNPPYHPTCPSQKGQLHISCEGGEDGQQILKEFLKASSQHLAKNGVICGIVNCRGGKLPEFLGYIRKWYKYDSIYWYPLHEPCSTRGFLEYITRWKESAWAKKIAQNFPNNHAGIYVIVRDNKRLFKIIQKKFHYSTPDWQFRWDAHRLIQDFSQ